MELIFYDEAVKVLGVTIDTLKHAVSRGELTKAGMQGNRQRLIKEQVMLFTGVNPRTGHKKRLSYNALSANEQRLWRQYDAEAQIATAPVPPAPARFVDEETVRRLINEQSGMIRQNVQSEFAEVFKLISESLSPKTGAIAV